MATYRQIRDAYEDLAKELTKGQPSGTLGKLSLLYRRAFMSLPMEERRQGLSEQAEEFQAQDCPADRPAGWTDQSPSVTPVQRDY